MWLAYFDVRSIESRYDLDNARVVPVVEILHLVGILAREFSGNILENPLVFFTLLGFIVHDKSRYDFQHVVVRTEPI